MSIPAILIFEKGKVKKQLVGFQSKEELKKIIDKLI
jgi:thioredoxin-like negative regulator of GroEL